MCGIVGTINTGGNTKIKTLESLKRLEYRGYDSSGILFFDKRSNKGAYKAIGKIVEMESTIPEEIDGSIAIAHTRWATHGKPTVDNTHPHQSEDGRIYLVHNGTIENYLELAKKYCQDVTLYGQTDSEIVANVLAYFLREENMFFLDALRRLVAEVEGGYAFAIIDTTNPEKIYFAKHKSPLIIGKGATEIFLASDILAIDPYVDEYMEIDDFTFGEVSESGVHIWNQDGEQQKKAFVACEKYENRVIAKDEFDHFMQKEIHQQPQVLKEILKHAVIDGAYTFDKEFIKRLKNANRVAIIAAGTSYHAGLVVAHVFEQFAKKQIDVLVASEFTYGNRLIDSNDVFMFFSQSGETADSRSALQKVKQFGATTMTLTNVKSSTLARESDFNFEIHAGVEVAVASTKAYVAQIATMIGVLHAYLGKDSAEFAAIIEQSSDLIATIILQSSIFSTYAKNDLKDTANAFYIGRQLGYALAVEAALKLKEVSYIQTEGFAAGELKHGTIALIEEGTPVIAFITDEKTAKLTRSNIEEVKARGASLFIISGVEYSHPTDDYIVNSKNELVLAIAMIVTSQLIAYHTAVLRGCDVDMPRNLAKSVTVE